MTTAKRFFAIAVFLLCALPAYGQGTQAGQEATITYSGTNVQIANSGTAATQFNTPSGLNTFIFATQPNSAIRFYITNNSANACSGAFTAQLFAASDSSVSSFNNQLQNWQIVPLQSTTSLVGTLPVNIPASGSIYFTSAAINSPRVAFQLVNTTGACGTTTMEVFAVIANVSLTSPLITTNNGSNFSGGAGQVQGVVPQQTSGATVNPIINGGLQPAINSAWAAIGLDNFNSTFASVPGFTPGITPLLASVPPPSNQNEVAIALTAGYSPQSGPNPSIFAPWTQAGSLAPGDNSALIGSVLTGAITGTQLRELYPNGANPGGVSPTVITLWQSGTTVRQASNVSTGGSIPSAVLSGSVIMGGVRCTGATPCTGNFTDSLGNTYQNVSVMSNSGATPPGMIVAVTTNKTSAGSDTITFTVTSGTAATGQLAMLELTGTTASPVVQPAVSSALDQLGGSVVRLDAQAPNQVNCTVTLSTNTTTQLTNCGPPASTSTGQALRLYITDIQLNTTTAGTATTIQLKDGTGSNCATGLANLSAITYANTAVGLQTFAGFRTPLIAPLSSAVCATQAGTTPGTTVVEVHGFIAP